MRGATECAKRLKSFLSDLKAESGKVTPPPTGDPLGQLILGILSRDTAEAKAVEGLERLRGMVVDYNELRVIPSLELAEILQDFPDHRLKSEDISRALNRIFARAHEVSLDWVAALPKRDQMAALLEIDGLDAYSAARIRLLGFEQHAVPLDEAMWELARRTGIIAPKCTLVEAVQFLERQLPVGDAVEFFTLARARAWATCGNDVRKGKVERILSIPPDRTTGNMLASVTASLTESFSSDADVDLDGDTDAEADDAAPAAPAKRSKRGSAAAAAKSAPAARTTAKRKTASTRKPAAERKPASEGKTAGDRKTSRSKPDRARKPAGARKTTTAKAKSTAKRAAPRTTARKTTKTKTTARKKSASGRKAGSA